MAFASVAYTANGSSTAFAIPFPYITRSHVEVLVNNVSLTSGFTVNGGTLTFTTAPAAGASVKIRRNTSQQSRLVNYTTGSIIPSTLNRDSLQAFYMAQEAMDAAADLGAPVANPVTGAAIAAALANTLTTPDFLYGRQGTNGGQIAADVLARFSMTDLLRFRWVVLTNGVTGAKSLQQQVKRTSEADSAFVDVPGSVIQFSDLGITSPGTDGPLSLALGSVTNLTATGFTLSINIGGTLPAGALMLIQWTDNLNGGTWRSSTEPTPASRGTYSFSFTGAPSGTLIYWRASVYTEPGGGQSAIIHASAGPESFTTPATTDAAPSYSRMVEEMDDANDGRSMRWVSFINNPNNVNTVGGPTGRPVPAVTAAGALARGTTVPTYTFGGLDPIPPQYQDADPWPIYTPWIVFLEEADLATGLIRQHAEPNAAFHIERCIFTVRRNSTSAWQTIRDRTDLQTWYTADEEFLVANGSVETRPASASEGGSGVVVRWPSGSGNAVHGSLKDGPIGFPMSTFENGIDLSSIVTDIRCLAVAYRIRLVPWNPLAPFNPANCRILAHVGCDIRVVDPHPWAIPPAILGRQRRLGTAWDWHTAITLRDTIRQDRQDGGSSVEAGFTKAQALANPIPGWLA